MKKISETDVCEVGGGFLSCSTLPPPANFVCHVGVAGVGLTLALLATDSNLGSTTNLSDVTAP